MDSANKEADINGIKNRIENVDEYLILSSLLVHPFKKCSLDERELYLLSLTFFTKSKNRF
jgi:hypothetical protein